MILYHTGNKNIRLTNTLHIKFVYIEYHLQTNVEINEKEKKCLKIIQRD